MWTTVGNPGTTPTLSTEPQMCHFQPVYAGGYAWGRGSDPYAGRSATYAQSTALITFITFIHHLIVRKASL